MTIIFISKSTFEQDQVTATKLEDTSTNWVATVSGETVTKAKADWTCFVKN